MPGTRALACDVVPEDIAESVRSRPHPDLQSCVTGYSGSRLEGFAGGIHLALPSPNAGALRMLGLPGSRLSDRVVDLADLWGDDAEELIDRTLAAEDWPARFAAVDSILRRRAGAMTRSGDPLARAWDLLLSTEGRLSVGDLVEAVGYAATSTTGLLLSTEQRPSRRRAWFGSNVRQTYCVVASGGAEGVTYLGFRRCQRLP